MNGHLNDRLKPWLVVAIVLVMPFFVSYYGHFLLATALIYFLVSLSLNVLTGMGGQVSIGHAAFWALGAYGGALATTRYGLPFPLAVLTGSVVATLAGALVALPAMRVRGHYLAIATLAFAILVQQVLFEWETLTGGREGLAVPRPEMFGYEFMEDKAFVYLLLGVAVFFAWMSENFRKSHTGQGLMMLKASPIAAQMSGVPRARNIIVAFCISAFLTGTSGALYGHLIGFLSTEAFTFIVSLSFLTMAVIGGLNTYMGAVLGALYLTFAPEFFRQFEDAQMVIYGVTLILCMRFLPGGLSSLPAVLRARFNRKKLP